MLREMERHKPTADISARVIQVSESVPAKILAYYILLDHARLLDVGYFSPLNARRYNHFVIFQESCMPLEAIREQFIFVRTFHKILNQNRQKRTL